MNINFGFTDELTNTPYAPLAALFAHYQHHNLLQPLENVQIPMQKRDFEPHEKLKQVLLSILAGCETLSEVNPRLKHKSVLARVIGNSRLSDQSSLSRTLDALTLKQIDELRVSTRQIWHKFSRVMTRDWRKYLWLDFDLTGLHCGAMAEASQKGYFAEKNARGRQLARVSAIFEGETVWSEAYPGNVHTVHCLQPAVLAAETALELAPGQRKRTVWRMDGGAGTDEHLTWLLARGYHVLAKGISNRRAESLARQVKRWDSYGTNAWLGEIDHPNLDYGRPVRVFVKRRLKDGQFLHSYYVSTLSLPSKGGFQRLYDARGGAEVEQFRNDKSGLSLEARRKRSFTGQLGYILLTDLAHNLLADFSYRGLEGSPFAGFAPKRIVRDLLNIPGRVSWHENGLQIDLLSQNQFSEALILCLERYCSGGFERLETAPVCTKK